ncbi:MAG: hypothetical protein ACKVJJ_08530, partial [Fidelibacterota bacterium]
MILKHGKQGSMSNFQWTEGILAIGFMITQNQWGQSGSKKLKKTIKDLKKEWSDRKIKKYKFRYRQLGARKTDSFFILKGDVTVENEKVIKVQKINFRNHESVNPLIEAGISDFRTIGQIYDFFEKEKIDSEESIVLLSKDISHPVWLAVDRNIGHFFEGQFIRLIDDKLFII